MKITYIHPAYPRHLQCLKVGRGCMVIIERKNDEKGTPYFWVLKVNGRDVVSSVAPFLVDGADPLSVSSGLPNYVCMKIVQEFASGLRDDDYAVMIGDPLFIESATEADWPSQSRQSVLAGQSAS